VSEFRVSAQDPTEPTPHPSDSCCRWTSPGFDNNAGALLFGPDDGYLYISAGGGGADDVGLGHVDDWPQEGVL
jgi:hypothetical protein